MALRRRLRPALPVLASLATLAAGAAPADAAPRRAFFGVNLAGDAARADFAELDKGRVGAARIGFFWHDVEPTRGASRAWDKYDRLVEGAAVAGTDVLAVLAGTPSFATDGSNDPPRTRSARTGYTAFVRDAVRRYGRGGDFWSAHPDLPYRPIVNWQVWNEPNLDLYWDGDPDPREYASLLAENARAIREENPDARVVLAGLPGGQGANQMHRYLAALYRVPGARAAFDAVAIHPYAVDVRGVLGALERVRRVMNRAGDRRTSIWVTEIGWATGYTGSFNSVSPRDQGAHLTRTFRALAQRRGRYRIAGVIWWSFRDAKVKQDFWVDYCGLFLADGKAKPAWKAFKRFSLRAA